MKPGRGLQGGCLYLFLAISGLAAGALPGTWHVRPASNSNNLNGVTYGNRVFVAAGNHGTILTSSNGTEWVTRSTGITNSTFFCAAWTFSGFHIGGEGVLSFWRDGEGAFNRFSGNGAEEMYAIVSEYQFLAVGRDRLAGKSFVVYQWKTNGVPTTNALYAISWRKARHGEIIVTTPFIAVGDRGTIIRSTNGIDWAVQESGTSVPLRAAVSHGDKIIVAGDDGVLLTSSNGISWTALPRLSFDIRALASSGIAVVAVGRHGGTGRVQVSADGSIWPEEPHEFAQPLNAVTHGQSSFVAVGDGGLIVESGYAPDLSVNAWTKPTSGLWEEQFWSCSRLPAADQGRIALTNAGSKSVEIGRSTTANFSNALSLFGLTVEAPPESSNQLLLNNAGTNVPLEVLYLTLGTNASFASYSSAVKADNFNIYSPAVVAERSRLEVGGLRLWSTLILSNSYAAIGTLRVHSNSAVHHFGGRSDLWRAVLSGGSSFTLHSGTFSIDEISLEYPVLYLEYSGKDVARILQDGGDLVAKVIKVGDPWNSNYRGEFVLQNGTLRCSSLEFYNGTFRQRGGTNETTSLSLPNWHTGLGGQYVLAGGTLVSRGVHLGRYGGGWPVYRSRGEFLQYGGVHCAGSISLNGNTENYGRSVDKIAIPIGFYSLSGGLLMSGTLNVDGVFTQTGGTNNAGLLSVSGGGHYQFSDGELTTTYASIGGFRPGGYSCYGAGGLTQHRGTHVVRSNLTISDFGTYYLHTGALHAPNIAIDPQGALRCSRGTISNSGAFSMRGGWFIPGAGPHQLGTLDVRDGDAEVSWPCYGATNTFVLDSGADVRFANSSHLAWSGAGLRIVGWRPGSSGDGAQRLFIGSDARGLTQEQLSKLLFVNPSGWRQGQYPARILKTGEIVPAEPPLLGLTRGSDGVALSWKGDYDLFRATNIAGPFIKVDDAASPATNLFSAPQQFFQLRLREE